MSGGAGRRAAARLRETAGRLGASLLVRLVTSFLTLAVAVVALAAFVAFHRARAVLRGEMLERLRSVAVVKEGELNLWIEHQRGDLVWLATLEPVRTGAARLAALPGAAPAASGPRTRLTAFLRHARGGPLEMDELFVLSAVGGRVLASTDSTRVGDYRVDDLFFQRGLGGTFVQNVYASPTTGRPTMTIATPVRDAAGTAVAVLGGHLNLTRVDQILAERTGLGATGEAYLVTPFNDFVSAGRFGRSEARRGVHSAGVREALAGRSGAGQYTNYAGREVLGAYRWNTARQLALLVELEAAEAFAPARHLAGTMLLFGLGAAVVFAAGIYVLARRIARPILGVARAASRVAAGDFDAVAPVETRDEVGLLARTFNEMTARLRTLYDDLSEQIAATGRAYRALEESQQLLQAVVDNTTNVILAVDREGRLLLVNRRVEDLFRVRRAEVRGQRPRAVFPAGVAEAIEQIAHEALRGAPVVERDGAYVVDGATHHYRLIAFPLADPDRPFGAGLVAVDLTDRVRAEEEHRRLEAGVQQAQKLESLGLLAGGIAHDFNNILTAIVGGASIALDSLAEGSPARDDLEQVVAAAERASKLTRQMLAYAGRASFAIETFDLNAVIREMAELLAVSVTRSVRLEQRLAEALPPIRGDRTQISQVVLNLVTNAAEATAAGGGIVTVRTSVIPAELLLVESYRFVPAPANAYIELLVADDGCGMRPETMERVFDPFYSTKGPGRGLGLAAVLGIVKQSGGTLKLESAPGAGTAFRVLFPAAEVEAPSAAAASAPAVRAAGAGRVLLVDDEEVVRRMTRRALERAGYEVLEAANGRRAVEVFARECGTLTAIVLDVTMPEMGGAEAFRRMRERGPIVPVIVSSGFDEQDTASGFTGEAVEFLQKPFRPAQLLDRLQAMIAAAPH